MLSLQTIKELSYDVSNNFGVTPSTIDITPEKMVEQLKIEEAD